MGAKTISVRKRDLAIKLQKIPSHPDPKVALEQYTVQADLAADLLFRACYEHGDVEHKTVLDLGTGTGRLALGASILGGEYVIGIDVDSRALSIGRNHSKTLGLDVDWVLGRVDALRGSVDTVVMNPPFGTRKAHADTDFLEAALRLARTVYSIHKSSTRNYLTKWLGKRTATSTVLISSKMEIPHQFSFHKKKRSYVDVDVYRIVRK